MQTITRRFYNEMGDGYHEYILITDPDGTNVQIIYVGHFFDTHTLSVIGGSSD